MKLTSIESMKDIMTLRRNAHKTWVLCHGVFDILHPGHIAHLQWARRQGDGLIVSVTPDFAVQKGPGRPVFNQEHRMEVLDALNCVDYVVLNNTISADFAIQQLQPNIYVKGPDIKRTPTLAFQREAEEVVRYGGHVKFSPPEPEFHSTDILNGKTQSEPVQDNVAPREG